MEKIRNSVTENVLSDPSLIQFKDYENFLFLKGKGWVADNDGNILGFSIVDLQNSNVWALFTHKKHEGAGIGSMLHKLMMDWYFSQTEKTIWLSTETNTRAHRFYLAKGWEEKGPYNKIETRLEMNFENFKRI